MGRRFEISKPPRAKRWDVTVRDPESELEGYRADVANWSSTALQLRIGFDDTAPVIAVCRLATLFQKYRFGLGDPDMPAKVYWEEMTQPTMLNNSYEWSMDMPSTGYRRSMLWKPTRKVRIEGVEASTWGQHYKLGDKTSDAVLAIYTVTSTTGPVRGDLQINIDEGGDFEILVVLSLLAILESSRREGK
ncbi:hypothetical protein B0I35DRAFT_476103 [Stachybotrys elegans]|uniref:Uncharacterized protein n=1 Tax=Stachybotrys elegans TaxID=80388 RepID=A0A8K0WU47_9HYPO|nr:hypothetical protein B0I35DRAFT_476103 [Stachybotrys elegans]